MIAFTMNDNDFGRIITEGPWNTVIDTIQDYSFFQALAECFQRDRVTIEVFIDHKFLGYANLMPLEYIKSR